MSYINKINDLFGEKGTTIPVGKKRLAGMFEVAAGHLSVTSLDGFPVVRYKPFSLLGRSSGAFAVAFNSEGDERQTFRHTGVFVPRGRQLVELSSERKAAKLYKSICDVIDSAHSNMVSSARQAPNVSLAI